MMKKILIVLLCCLLLFGCGTDMQPEETSVTTEPTVQTQPAKPAGYYDPDSLLESATGGAVRCYPLRDIQVSDLLLLADNPLLISAAEYSAELTLLTGEDGVPAAQMHIDSWLTRDTDSLHRWDGGISFYEDGAGRTLVLDNSLRTVSTIDPPEGLIGNPILSTDRTTLYYCTNSGIRALELETGISRCLKEIAYPYQVLTGLWINDTILECAISDERGFQTLFISIETGEILYSLSSDPLFQSADDRYYATIVDSSVVSNIFGEITGQTMHLQLPDDTITSFYLPDDHAVVSLSSYSEEEILVNYIDLYSGLCVASLSLNSDTFPWSFRSDGNGTVYFLNYDHTYSCQVLYKWDTPLTPSRDDNRYAGLYYTKEEPDAEGLAECLAYAQEIGRRHGVEVLIHKEAARVEPYDYDIEYEHLVGVIDRELELLDRNLSRYPEGFLATLASRFDGLSICIVRTLAGTAEAGSLDTADGIQFMDGYHAYIALAAASNTEYALYHEMCHLIDTMVISETGAYDRWDELNPAGFEYDFDYITNQNRDGSAYLQDHNRAFIDTYSMSFPKEDRARIMEYAMTEGNEAFFRSSTMQAKLKLLCEGIRRAFGLRKSPETFLWEQYLNTSLAYTE